MSAAEWQLIGYRLPENGHPCINDPYTQAGYVWIRKDGNNADNREKLKAAVKAQNEKADIESAKPVRAGQSAFLIKKSVKCRDWDRKQEYLVTSYAFATLADEPALRKHMEVQMKLYPEIVDYSFEDITRSTQELDRSGDATVIGRAK